MTAQINDLWRMYAMVAMLLAFVLYAKQCLSLSSWLFAPLRQAECLHK
jgi:choline-glycine betaine transporter